MLWRFPGVSRLLLCGLLASGALGAEPIAFTDEGQFLVAAAALDLALLYEGFESDADWGAVRTSIVDGVHAAPSITAQGLVWSANNLSSGITTSEGAARSGQWGVYSYPHGSYATPDPGADCYLPGACGDGFRGRLETGVLRAVGGWVHTNTPFAKIGLFLGNYPDNPVDFGETCEPPDSENCVANAIIGTTPKFFGVIDEAGFERFEYRELEGKLEVGGGDLKYIFADDFRISPVGGPLIFRDGFE